MSQLRSKYWERVPLDEMTRAEWEALCDGCGKCCVLKLEDEDTSEVHYTDIGCRLLDGDTCRCTQYPLRKMLVAGCVILSPETLPEIRDWMPRTCAYRLLAEGGRLPDWHPLRTGDPESTHSSGNSVRGKVVPEWEVAEEDMEDHIVARDF